MAKSTTLEVVRDRLKFHIEELASRKAGMPARVERVLELLTIIETSEPMPVGIRGDLIALCRKLAVEFGRLGRITDTENVRGLIETLTEGSEHWKDY